MEYIDLRKVGRDGLTVVRRQVVRLKKMGKTGKEIEEITGVRQNRISKIWTAYQREGESSLKRKKYERKPGTHMVLTPEEQKEIRIAIQEKRPEDYEITGKLWTLGRTRQYIQKRFGKEVHERTLSDYMKRWGMSCQRPAKRARKQNPTGIYMYNFTELVASSVIIQHVSKKYSYNVNFSVAVHIYRLFFLGNAAPPNVDAILRRYISPIRPGRCFPRNSTPKHIISFTYRLA